MQLQIMNILHLAPYFPSLKAVHAGGVCMGKEVEGLDKYGKVYKLSFIQEKYDLNLYKNEKDETTYAVLLSKVDKILAIFTHMNMPLLFSTRSSKKYKNEIRRILKSDKDVQYVHAEYTAMGQYFRYIKKIKSDIKLIYVLHDVTFQSYERQIENTVGFIKKIFLEYQKALVKKCELKWINESDYVLVFSDKDKKLLEGIYNTNSEKIRVINTYFELDKKVERLTKYVRKQDNEIHFFFYGQLLREENREAAMRAIEIYEQYKIGTDKKTKLFLIGNSKNSDLLNYQKEDIICTGFIDDVDRYIIENCDVAVFPLNSGAGIKVKVLHCLALGIPVITGEIGAEGIDNTGKYIYLAETDKEYIEMMYLLEDINIRNIRRKDNIEYINGEFSWLKTKKVFGEIYSKKGV